MSDPQLTDAIDRAERAMSRLDRAAQGIESSRDRADKLRSTVRDVVTELESILAPGNR